MGSEATGFENRKVLVVDADNGMTQSLLAYLKSLAPWQVNFFPASTDTTAILSQVRQYNYLIAPFLPLDRTFFENKGRLEAISVNAIGVNSIDLDAARKAGVPVFSLTDYCTDEVAEHAIAMMMALFRQIEPYETAADASVATSTIASSATGSEPAPGTFSYLSVAPPRRVAGSTAGVFGFGRIGRAFAKRALGLGMKVLFYKPEDRNYILPEEFQGRDVAFASKEEIFEKAECISNHMAANDSNYHFFDRAAFSAMKKHPVFINTGRGVTVDTEALISAIDEGILYGAGLDVLEDKSDLALLLEKRRTTFPNLIVTPHAAFCSEESMDKLVRQTADNLYYYVAGEPEKITAIH